uniref:P53 and DNA damage-regulated protein 1 n=1 Tax=Chlamydomonas leiostraca TaxID=1034604 RepID=A0A7S0R1T5_9CHLO
MGTTMLKLQDALSETERLGERFLDVRAQMVALDKQRQENREALTAVRKQQDDKVWLQRGSTGLWKLPKQRAIEHLEQDQKHIDQQLDELTRELKKLTALLADKGAGPAVGPGMLNAMLHLRDTEAERDSDDEDD